MLIQVLIAGVALAYETDQLTDRELPLADSEAIANAEMDAQLDQVLLHLNAQGCGAPDGKVYRTLGRAIHAAVGTPAAIPERGLLRRFGFDTYTRYLERHPGVDKRTWTDRQDIYADLKPWESPVLAVAGPSSTLRFGDVLLGTDKLSHFVDLGWTYARKSRRGRRPARAVRWGTRTELRQLGLLTSNAFSYADLRANWDGYRFYRDLLEDHSIIQREPRDGCLVRTRDWRWSDYVDDDYDETQNPSVYSPVALDGITGRIAREPERYCRAWVALGEQDWLEQLRLQFAEQPEWVGKHAPARTDPFQLFRICRKDAD